MTADVGGSPNTDWDANAILDTFIAATYAAAECPLRWQHSTPQDFRIFDVFEFLPSHGWSNAPHV